MNDQSKFGCFLQARPFSGRAKLVYLHTITYLTRIATYRGHSSWNLRRHQVSGVLGSSVPLTLRNCRQCSGDFGESVPRFPLSRIIGLLGLSMCFPEPQACRDDGLTWERRPLRGLASVCISGGSPLPLFSKTLRVSPRVQQPGGVGRGARLRAPCPENADPGVGLPGAKILIC